MPPKKKPEVLKNKEMIPVKEDEALHQQDDNDDSCEEDEEYVEEEIIIEEKVEQVEELILFRIKETFGMYRTPGDNIDETTLLTEESAISLTNFNTVKPLLTFSNGLVLEGSWTETHGNLASIGITSTTVVGGNNSSSRSM